MLHKTSSRVSRQSCTLSDLVALSVLGIYQRLSRKLKSTIVSPATGLRESAFVISASFFCPSRA